MKNFDTLQEDVLVWADKVGIFSEGSLYGQLEKLIEEAQEVADADDEDHRLEEMGDLLVVLIILAGFMKVDLISGLHQAYEKIEARKGLMKGGKFVKYDNLSDEERELFDTKPRASGLRPFDGMDEEYDEEEEDRF